MTVMTHHAATVRSFPSPLDRAIACLSRAQHRLANPDIRSDVFAITQREIRHWRKELIRLRLRGGI